MRSTNSKKNLRLTVRQRELQAVRDLLAQVSQFNEAKKRRWLQENSEFIMGAVLSFLEMNQEEIAEVDLNLEAGRLSLEILELLTETTDAMKQAFSLKPRLEA